MEPEKTGPLNGRKKKIAFIGLPIVILLAVIGLFFYISYKKTHISTDDAYVDGRVYTIAPKVSGTVKQVYVDENRFVKKGDLLLEIDESDYAVKVSETGSDLETERARRNEIAAQITIYEKQLSEARFKVESDKANLEAQKASLLQAERDMKRAEDLFKEELVSKERYENTKTEYEVAQARYRAAQEQLKQSESAFETRIAMIRQSQSSLSTQAAKIGQKEASFRAAELNKSYTRIYAPSDGFVTKKSVEAGDLVQAGRPLMAVVALNDVWITANYKETQLARVCAGQKVKVKVDSYPGKVFEGKVESIMAGTGSAFSLFPPENATGNYVKIVQRIPVKIVLNAGADPNHMLRIGMSVTPIIFTGK
jgi:membrane fusion protein (multidrug efflux system)